MAKDRAYTGIRYNEIQNQRKKIIRNFTSLEMQHKNNGFEDLEDVNG